MRRVTQKQVDPKWKDYVFKKKYHPTIQATFTNVQYILAELQKIYN